MRHVICSVVILSSLAGAQVRTGPVSRYRQEGPSREERAVARALIDDALREASGLKVPENLVMVRSAAASLIQEDDSERAAAILAEVAPALKSLIDAAEPGSQEWSMFTNVRSGLIQQLANKEENVSAAIKFLHDSQPARSDEESSRRDNETELQLMSRLASREPDAARKALIRSLETSGLTQIAPMILQRQLQDNPGAARNTLDLLLVHLRDPNPDPRNLFFAQLNLLNTLDYELAHRPKTIVMRSDAMKVAESLSSSALELPFGTFPYSDLAFAEVVRRYSPPAYDVIRAKWEEQTKAQSDAIAKSVELNETTDIDKALELVEAAPAYQRPNLYQQVAMRAASRGDMEQARRLVEQKVRDPYARGNQFKELARQNAFYLASRGDMQGAMAQLRDAGLRRSEMIQALVQLAMQSNKENRKEPLDEALKLIPSPPPDAAALQNLLTVTQASSQIDPSGAEETLAPLIGLLNQQLPSVAAVDGFANGHAALRNGELLLLGGGYPSPQYANIIQQITELAGKAPERALRLARQLGTPELRAYSMLGIAGSILRKPIPMFYGGGYCGCY